MIKRNEKKKKKKKYKKNYENFFQNILQIFFAIGSRKNASIIFIPHMLHNLLLLKKSCLDIINEYFQDSLSKQINLFDYYCHISFMENK